MRKAIPVGGVDIALCPRLGIIEAGDVLGEGAAQLPYLFGRGLRRDALQRQEEIVAADMADQPLAVYETLLQQLGKQQDRPVTLPETVGIVEWLEIIEVEIDQRDRKLGIGRRRRHIGVDRIVSRQLGQRVLVARGGDVLLVDQPQQRGGG